MPKEVSEEVHAVKEVIRELHELIQEAKDVQKSLVSTIEDFKGSIDSKIEKEVKEGLTSLANSIDNAISESTDAVYKRFDTVTEILVGESKKNRKKGQPSLIDLAKKV